VVNSDGSSPHEITFPVYGVAESPQAGTPFGNIQSLASNPDSTRLAFKGSTYGTFCGMYAGFPTECEAVGVINVDGTGQNLLVRYDLNEAGSAWSIDWSPDGTLIAYAHNSVNFGGPAIAFIDLSGQGRYANGLNLVQLGIQSSFGGEVCATDRHCLHFSPDSTKLAYENNNPSDNPTFRGISTINLAGTGRNDSLNLGQTLENGIWWNSGASFQAAAQLTLSPNPVEVWPGSSQQLNPTLLDANNNLVFHAAASYTYNVQYGTNGCIEIGPYGLAMYRLGGDGSGSISATNEGKTSNSVAFKWQSPPCVFTLNLTSESFPAAGGSDTIGVIANSSSTGSSCPWRSLSNASWITITSGSTGSGNGSVSFTVAANSGDARQGTMTIAGLTFTVNQDPAGRVVLQSITISPVNATILVRSTRQFTATGHYNDGGTRDLTSTANWSSVNTSVATITSSGLATAVVKGLTIIKAAVGDRVGLTLLTVKISIQDPRP